MLVEMCRYSNSSGLRNHWAYIEEGVQLDPLSPVSHVCISDYFWINGPVTQAAQAARRAVELAPEVSAIHLFEGWTLAEAGATEEGGALIDQAARLVTDEVGRATAQFLKHVVEGNAAAALSATTPAMERATGNESWSRIMAGAYAQIGRAQDSLRWLQAAVDRGFIHYPNLSQDPVLLELLGQEPAFQSLLAEVKPRWEAAVQWERGLGGPAV